MIKDHVHIKDGEVLATVARPNKGGPILGLKEGEKILPIFRGPHPEIDPLTEKIVALPGEIREDHYFIGYDKQSLSNEEMNNAINSKYPRATRGQMLVWLASEKGITKAQVEDFMVQALASQSTPVEGKGGILEARARLQEVLYFPINNPLVLLLADKLLNMNLQQLQAIWHEKILSLDA